MSEPFPMPEEPLDRAVRIKLDAEAGAADPGRLLARLHQKLATDAIGPIRRRRRWLIAAAGALAASLLIGVFLIIPGRSVQASPRRLVERARTVHQEPADRCYAVHAAASPEVQKRFPRVEFDLESRLWTRGDRYFVELPKGRGTWGRDEAKRVWFVPTPDVAARFDDDEVPAAFREFLDIRAVNLSDLLDEVLAECDLSWANNVETPDDVRRVYAVSRDAARSLRGAVIDVEYATNTVRRLSLDRQLFRDPRAKVSITFTLIDSSPPDLNRYGAEGHLNPGAPILDRNHPAARLALLARYSGPFKQD